MTKFHRTIIVMSGGLLIIAGVLLYGLFFNSQFTLGAYKFNPFTQKLDYYESGGTGSSPLTTKGDLFTYSSTSTRLAVGTNGKILMASSTTLTGLAWTATSSLGISGGSGTPGGSDTQIQFNNGGSFGGDSRFYWDANAPSLIVPGFSNPNAVGEPYMDFSNSLEVGFGANVGDSDNGGSITYTAGNGGATIGDGGSIYLTSGTATNGNNGLISLNSNFTVNSNGQATTTDLTVSGTTYVNQLCLTGDTCRTTWPTGGGMVYPGAGIALSTGAAWSASITNNSANWNTAYSDLHATGSNSMILQTNGTYPTWKATNTLGFITASQVPTYETDSAHDACSEISGCVVGAITSVGSDSTWANHNSYPAGCTTGVVTAIGDTLTCISTSTYDTAYTDRLKWDGGSTGLTAATGRTSLGLGTMAIEANTGTTTITTLGTIGTGVWGGTAIPANKGGTALTTFTNGSLLYASAANTWAALGSSTLGYILSINSTGYPAWQATSTLNIPVVNYGTTGQIPYYAANGTSLTATSSIFISTKQYVGIGSSSPNALFTVDKGATGTTTVQLGEIGSPACLKIRDNDNGAFSYCSIHAGTWACSTTSCQ